MFGHWYNSSLRRYIVLMGDLFSHIQVAKEREDTGITYTRVPISYASKEHFMLQLNKLNAIQSTQNIAKVETVLPRMNLHLVDIQYNAPFKTAILNKTLARYSKDDPRRQISQYNPTPIKMIFELGIYTRYQDDMFQIVEQIMPYFQPHFNTTIQELYPNDIQFTRDINIVFQSISPDEQLEGPDTSRRRLEWSIMFEVNGWLYPPVKEIKGEIRTIYVNFFGTDRELTTEGNFESVDTQAIPVDSSEEDWEGEYKQTYSSGKPIPVSPEPPAPR